MSCHDDFSKLYGSEVYVVTKESTSVVAKASVIEFVHSFTDVMDILKNFDPVRDDNVKVYHGILAPANVLPEELHNTNVFMITFNPYSSKNEGVVLPATEECDVEDLADDIENLVTSGSEVTHATKMESTYLLYGYELDVCLGINEENIDEKIINTCSEIVDEVRLTIEATKIR